MLSNLIFCLNATIPIFLLMVLGYIFKKIHIFDDALTSGMNSFVFKVALPILVYKELASQDFKDIWDAGFILYCFFATLISIIIAYIIATFFTDKTIRSEFVQGSYRSSAALLGVGIAINLYGNAGMVPLMIIGAVPLYNIVAVIVLTVDASGESTLTPSLIKKTLIGVITNPIIIGIILGLLRSFVPHDLLLPKTVNFLSGLATPLGLLALGASFEFSDALKKLAPTLVATFLKLIGFCAMWIPLAVQLGYRDSKLIAILIMAGSPTTVSSFVMAKNMGHDGTVSAGIVMLTTLLSAFTLTLWLYILKTLGYI